MDEIQQWPETGLEIGSCPLCRNDKRQLLYDRLTDRVTCSAAGVWSLYRCACGLVYLDPRPNAETISLAYEGNYYTHEVSAIKVQRGLRLAHAERLFEFPLWLFIAECEPMGNHCGAKLSRASVAPWTFPSDTSRGRPESVTRWSLTWDAAVATSF